MYLTPREKTFIGMLAGILIAIVAWNITPRQWKGWFAGCAGVLAVFTCIFFSGGRPYECFDCERVFSKGSRSCPNCGGTRIGRLLSK